MSGQRTARWHRLADPLLPWLVPVSLVLLWQAAVQYGWISTRIAPPPSEVLQAACPACWLACATPWVSCG